MLASCRRAASCCRHANADGNGMQLLIANGGVAGFGVDGDGDADDGMVMTNTTTVKAKVV